MTIDSDIVDHASMTAMENDAPLLTDASVNGTPRLLITKMVRN
jgi:hypothetical protein